MIAFALAAALAQAPSPAPVVSGPTPAADVWEKRCTFCHGADGRSQTKKGKQLNAPDFTSDKWQKHTTDDEIIEAIHDGIPKHKMPSFKSKLSDEEIKSMVPFLRAFAKR